MIATTRPETIMGDTAVAVNPNDDRMKKYIGKKIIVPLVDREVEVIADYYVDIALVPVPLRLRRLTTRTTLKWVSAITWNRS